MKLKKHAPLRLKSGVERQILYFYACSVCHKRRQTVYEVKTAPGAKVCRICQKIEANKSQMSLLDTVIAANKAMDQIDAADPNINSKETN